MGTAPAVSVVIPTYNQAAELAATLDTLTAQQGAGAFEVIVTDDGSGDGTAELVRSFADRLDVRYCWQPDRGFRAAAARNAGARLASSPALVFLDTGTLAGPGFVAGHRELLARPGTAVIGYAYGYRPWDDGAELAAALRTMTPGEIVARHGDAPWIRDWRDELFDPQRVDPAKLAAPWLLYQGMNCSVRAEDFHAIGGYDEEFRHWGVDDIEMGFRLYRRGVAFTVGARAWAMEVPGPRDMGWRLADVKHNGWYFLEKFREPVAEILWRNLMLEEIWPVEPEYQAVLEQAERTRALDVHDELAAAVRRHGLAGRRVAVFGCGARVPDTLAGATLADFDADRLAETGRAGHHAIGIRTPIAGDSHDAVVITSRLAGLWERFGNMVHAEARRIAPLVVGPPAAGGRAAA
jgi:glycosyltransferase involved in cell wall biosynthesis